MSKTVLVPLAQGFEEIEAVTIIDVLRRGGIKVIIAGLDNDTLIEGAHGIYIEAETRIGDIAPNFIDMIVLPGGLGGTNILATNAQVQHLIQQLNKDGKHIGAICAAPYALDKAGVLHGEYVCYPGFEEKIGNKNCKKESDVVKSGKIITSKGPATAMCFALEIVKILEGEERYTQVKNGLLADHCS